MMKKFLSFLLLSLCSGASIWADDSNQGLRFVSTKSDEINVRSGPGSKYHPEWVIVKKNEPFAVTREFGQWRHLKDRECDIGWVHSSLLSNKRYVIINHKENVQLMKNKSSNSRVIAQLEPELRCLLKSCKEDWCKINCNSYVGWVRKNYLWGVNL